MVRSLYVPSAIYLVSRPPPCSLSISSNSLLAVTSDVSSSGLLQHLHLLIRSTVLQLDHLPLRRTSSFLQISFQTLILAVSSTPRKYKLLFVMQRETLRQRELVCRRRT